MKQFSVGVDIGGSHISCALVDMFEGSMVKDSLIEMKVNNKAKADEILDDWSLAINTTLLECGKENVGGIGFAMPGPFAYDRGVALFSDVVDKFENLFGINVSIEVSKRLQLNSDVPVRFMNDASAFAVGEAWLGQAANDSNSVSITLGTGFGSAFIKDGVPSIAGEGVPPQGCLWHLPFKDGIADDFFSTRWFVNSWNKISGETVNGVKDVADKTTSDKKAKTLFDEFGFNLGIFLAPWLNRFTTDVLVIGGNVSGAYNLFGPAFEKQLETQNCKAKITKSVLKETAAIIGSARMIAPDYYKKIEKVLPFM